MRLRRSVLVLLSAVSMMLAACTTSDGTPTGAGGLSTAVLPLRGNARQISPGKKTHSERDWAWVVIAPSGSMKPKTAER